MTVLCWINCVVWFLRNLANCVHYCTKTSRYFFNHRSIHMWQHLHSSLTDYIVKPLPLTVINQSANPEKNYEHNAYLNKIAIICICLVCLMNVLDHLLLLDLNLSVDISTTIFSNLWNWDYVSSYDSFFQTVLTIFSRM